MSKRKPTSTNSLNQEILNDFCGVNYAISLIEGRWKMIILYKLEKGPMRYSDLKRKIPNVTDRMLTLQLKELEKHQLVKRTIQAAVPPIVTYELAELGMALAPIWKSLERWGWEHRLKTEMSLMSQTA